MVLLQRVLQPVLRKRPQWLKPFIVEKIDDADLQKLTIRRPFSHTARLLLVLVTIGLVSDLVSLFWPRHNLVVLLPAVSWVRHPENGDKVVADCSAGLCSSFNRN